MKTLPTEAKIRIVAGFVLILIALFIYKNWFFIPVFLTIDFGLRGFGKGQYSLLGIWSDALVKAFKMPQKPVYFPIKQFAAQIGFLFSVILIILNVFQINALLVATIFAVCAGLEAFFNFCVGCWFFNSFQSFKNKK